MTDSQGRTAYDFAVVQVYDPDHPDRLPPTLHPAFAPTTAIRAGDEITFLVRSFRNGARPAEVWDFGDGTPPVTVHSDGNADPHNQDGYARTKHAFKKSGDYIVTVRTANPLGFKATAHLWVRVLP